MAKSKFLKHTFKKITKSQAFMSFLSLVIYGYARLVWKSGKWSINGLDKMLSTWQKSGSIILIGWHNRVPMMPMLMEHAQGKMSALVSLHNDGRMIAGFLEKFGIGIISGSSNNNAKGAAVNMGEEKTVTNNGYIDLAGVLNGEVDNTGGNITVLDSGAHMTKFTGGELNISADVAASSLVSEESNADEIYVSEGANLNLDSEDLKVEFTEPMKAITMKAEPEENFFHIIMPMQME